MESLKAIEAKLAALADKYDARAYEMATQAVQDSVAALEEGAVDGAKMQ